MNIDEKGRSEAKVESTQPLRKLLNTLRSLPETEQTPTFLDPTEVRGDGNERERRIAALRAELDVLEAAGNDDREPQNPREPRALLPIRLHRTAEPETSDITLWKVIQNRAEAIGFNRYREFADAVMSGERRRRPAADTATRVRLGDGGVLKTLSNDFPTIARDAVEFDADNASVYLTRDGMLRAFRYEPVEAERYVRATAGSVSLKNFFTELIPFLENPGAERSGVRDFEKNEVWQDARAENAANRLTTLGVHGSHAFDLLKVATECFLMQECGLQSDFQRVDALRGDSTYRRGNLAEDMRQKYLVQLGKNFNLPYIDLVLEKLRELPLKPTVGGELALGGDAGSYGILRDRATSPCLIELLWSYWHEEGMIIQAMNAISMRFQNRRWPDGGDGLAQFAVDPLRPLSNLMWGYIEDEMHRLTVVRRSYEYENQYGLKLLGRAVPNQNAADRRSKFIEAFHNLLNLCAGFFKEHDDTTVHPDGFPLLNSLRELHIIMAQGAHNQFGDLPWKARTEMLTQQWLLARPEMREFLGRRVMVPYQEPWMDRVDTLKQLYGWTDVTITHFRDLAHYGEQILLSIRYGNWLEEVHPATASNWAVFWRPGIQRYIHAYRAATGADLSASSVDATMPGALLLRRLKQQQAGSARR